MKQGSIAKTPAQNLAVKRRFTVVGKQSKNLLSNEKVVESGGSAGSISKKKKSSKSNEYAQGFDVSFKQDSIVDTSQESLFNYKES